MSETETSNIADPTEALELAHTCSSLSKVEKRRKDKSNFATVDKVLDPKTVKIIESLLRRNKLAELSGAVSSGKEANVYTAKCCGSLVSKFIQPGDTPEGAGTIPVVLKIYKTSTMMFKDRTRYIVDEKRFKSFCTSNRLKMIKLWSEKEVRNLKRLEKSGIPCPRPLYLKGSILVMTMVGGAQPACRLRDADLTAGEWGGVYDECVGLLRDMYQKARLVHADFSEYNLLYHDGRVHVIDVGQSMDVFQENSNTFLVMDVVNCNEFFRKKGVRTRDETALFEEITGLKIPEYLKVDGRLSKESFIPTRITEVANEEDFLLFTGEGETSSRVVLRNKASKTSVGADEAGIGHSVGRLSLKEEPKEEERVGVEGRVVKELYVRRLSLKNPEISKEEEKEINKVRKGIIKEMNRERRAKKVAHKAEYKKGLKPKR